MNDDIAHCTLTNMHYGVLYRKPQTAKTKNGIQDWHLMVFVSLLLLVDVIGLTFYTLLEGLVDRFGVLQVPSKENLSAVTGVRWSSINNS